MQMYLTSGARPQILPTNSHWHYSRCVLLRIHYKDKPALLRYNLIPRPPSQEPGNETTPHCSSPSSYPWKQISSLLYEGSVALGLDFHKWYPL